jgi:hypothetical protein
VRRKFLVMSHQVSIGGSKQKQEELLSCRSCLFAFITDWNLVIESRKGSSKGTFMELFETIEDSVVDTHGFKLVDEGNPLVTSGRPRPTITYSVDVLRGLLRPHV